MVKSKMKVSWICIALICVFALIFAFVPITNSNSIVSAEASAEASVESVGIEEYAESLVESISDSENYAGLYIDDDNVINICVTEDINVKSLKTNSLFSAAKNSSIPEYDIVKEKYSAAYLNEIADVIRNNMTELLVSGVGVRYSENSVVIEIDELSMSEQINAYLSREVVDFECDAVRYESATENKETVEALSGYKIRGGGYQGTIGFNAYDTSTDTYGVVTNYHVAPPDRKMYYKDGANLIGTMSKGSKGDKVDVAFIPFKNAWIFRQWSATYKLGDQNDTSYTDKIVGVSKSYVEGAKLKKYGLTTGRTYGKILVSDYSFTMNDIQYNDCVKYSCSSKSGDSGGPFGSYAPRSGGFSIKGINFAGPKDNSGDYGIGCKITNILSMYNLQVVTKGGNRD